MNEKYLDLIDSVIDEQEVTKEKFIKEQMQEIRDAKKHNLHWCVWLGNHYLHTDYCVVADEVLQLFESKGYHYQASPTYGKLIW